MNSDRDKSYKKIVNLDEIYRFVVQFFLYRIIFILKSWTQSS